MKTIIYHPEVISPEGFNAAWFGDRAADLIGGYWGKPVVFGFDRQYDRTIDENGNPGEYVQVWMRIEGEEC